MITITFDTNCIIDLAENRPSASDIRSLICMHRAGLVDAAFVAVSASERQKGDYYLSTYADFQRRLDALEAGDLPQLVGIAYCDISYWDRALYADEDMIERERLIHSILFPNLPFTMVANTDPRFYRKWRNAWCDRQMFWAHDNFSRDIFITSDTNFSRLVGHPFFPRAMVRNPREMTQLIEAQT